jgi:hypothetical protein
MAGPVTTAMLEEARIGSTVETSEGWRVKIEATGDGNDWMDSMCSCCSSARLANGERGTLLRYLPENAYGLAGLLDTLTAERDELRERVAKLEAALDALRIAPGTIVVAMAVRSPHDCDVYILGHNHALDKVAALLGQGAVESREGAEE